MNQRPISSAIQYLTVINSSNSSSKPSHFSLLDFLNAFFPPSLNPMSVTVLSLIFFFFLVGSILQSDQEIECEIHDIFNFSFVLWELRLDAKSLMDLVGYFLPNQTSSIAVELTIFSKNCEYEQ